MTGLDRFSVPISSGLLPASGGGLSAARRAQLERDLAALADARARASVEVRAR